MKFIKTVVIAAFVGALTGVASAIATMFWAATRHLS